MAICLIALWLITLVVWFSTRPIQPANKFVSVPSADKYDFNTYHDVSHACGYEHREETVYFKYPLPGNVWLQLYTNKLFQLVTEGDRRMLKPIQPKRMGDK